MRIRNKVLLAGLLVAGAIPAVAQEYPTRAVKLVCPFAAGGSSDALTRIIGAQLHGRWNQPVVIENRVGASGNIGAEVVAKNTAPDGYTLLVAGAPHAIGASLFSKLRYDLAKDLVAISNIATFSSVLVAHPSLPVKSVKDLIALARRHPGEINFASPNIGSPNHLALELFQSMAKVKMVHIPYKGGSGGQLTADLIGGQVQLASMGFPPAIPQIRNGRLRAIAVTSLKRSRLLPEVPTVDESGLPGFEVSSWYGLFGPAAMPREIVAKVNADTRVSLGSTEAQSRLATLGAEPAPGTPEEFGKLVQAEIAKWAKVVKESGARAD